MITSSTAAAALLSTGLISLAPNLLLLLFPSIDARASSSQSLTQLLLTLGQSLAAGALLGDVFLHIMPHAKGGDDSTGMLILAGFSLFLTADLLIRVATTTEHAHHHHHSATPHQNGNSSSSNGVQSNGSNHEINNKAGGDSRIKFSTVALNLIADSMHNFTDGLAIGASFTAVNPTESIASMILSSRGGLATLSIMLHEIPHELGDFCTLLQAGYSRNQAILAQFLTAVAAFLGTIVALYLSSSSIFAGDQLELITAGGFVYLACVTILPEVLGEDGKKSLLFSAAQLAAFLTGIAFMQGVAILEGHGHGGHSHDHHHDHHHDAFTAHGHHDHHHHHAEEMHHGHVHADSGEPVHHHDHAHGEL